MLEFYYFSAVEIKADRAIDFERLKNSNLSWSLNWNSLK